MKGLHQYPVKWHDLHWVNAAESMVSKNSHKTGIYFDVTCMLCHKIYCVFFLHWAPNSIAFVVFLQLLQLWEKNGYFDESIIQQLQSPALGLGQYQVSNQWHSWKPEVVVWETEQYSSKNRPFVPAQNVQHDHAWYLVKQTFCLLHMSLELFT